MSPLSAAAVDPPPTKKPRGNPTLALVPRCGARTRGGCPCRAPAIHGKLRCRMHGGRSTGPRTPEGLARLRAARTSHDNVAAKARALDRWRLTLLRRSRVDAAAQRYQAHLPPAFVARLYCHPPELTAPPKPTGGITAAQDRVRRRAVAAALAPWQQAIAAARTAERADRAAARVAKAHAPVGKRPPRGAGVPGPHAPIPGAAALAAAARLAKPGAPVGACSPRDAGVPEPHAPIPGAADPAATARLAKPGAPVGACSPRDAGVPGPHAPIPGAAASPPPPAWRNPVHQSAHAPRATPAYQKPMHQFPAPPAPAVQWEARGWPDQPPGQAPPASPCLALVGQGLPAMTGGGAGGPKPHTPIPGPAPVPLEPATGGLAPGAVPGCPGPCPGDRPPSRPGCPTAPRGASG